MELGNFWRCKQKIDTIITDISIAENQLTIQWDSDTDKEMVELKAYLTKLLGLKYSMIEDKTRLNWIKEGHRSTKLFHATIKSRRKHKQM